MLADREAVISLLRDPCGLGQLSFEEQVIRGAASGQTYPYHAGQPVLVLFSHSVLKREIYGGGAPAEVVERRPYLAPFRTLWRAVSRPSRNTVRNLRRVREELLGRPDPLLLVVGGGTIGQGMQPLYDCETVKIIAFDIYPSDVTHFIADAHDIPLASDSVDAVVIQAVLEHVLVPCRVVEEIWRVLKPGGLVYSETPFMQQVHEGPYDFTRFTQSGHRYLFGRFASVATGVNGGPGTVLVWSIDYLMRGLCRSRAAGKLFKTLFFWLCWLDRLIPEDFSSDGASGSFFLGRKKAQPLAAAEIVPFYRGAERRKGDRRASTGGRRRTDRPSPV